MLAIVEYASIRFRLVCAMATMWPSATDSTRQHDQHALPLICISAPPSAPASRRSSIANAANSGAVPISSVIAVGAPWYTSGTHM